MLGTDVLKEFTFGALRGSMVTRDAKLQELTRSEGPHCLAPFVRARTQKHKTMGTSGP